MITLTDVMEHVITTQNSINVFLSENIETILEKRMVSQGADKKSSKEKKKGKGILRHGETKTKSFIPLFREPSSIEKILGEADQLLIRPHTSPQESKTPPVLRPVSPRAASPKAASFRASSPKPTSPKAPFSPKVASPKPVSPKAAPLRTFSSGATSSKTAPPKVKQNRKEISYVQRPEPTLQHQILSATKIQAAYRGFLVSFLISQ